MVAAALNSFYNIYLRTRSSNLTVTVHNNPLPRNIESQVILCFGDNFHIIFASNWVTIFV